MNDGKKDKSKILYRAAIFGVVFGFLLQKGGVAKYHILVGQLLLEDFTVIKVMLSAILTAMIGHHLLLRKNKVETHIKPMRPLSNLTGGMIFGMGFAFAGFCPGTGAAALGQGDFETVFYISGMFVGSYLYAETSPKLEEFLKRKKETQETILPDLLQVRKDSFLVFFSLLLLGALFVLRGVR